MASREPIQLVGGALTLSKQSMNRKNIYLGMTIVGTLAPMIVGAPYLLEYGYNPAHLM